MGRRVSLFLVLTTLQIIFGSVIKAPNEKDSGLEDNDQLMNGKLFEGDIILPKEVSPRTDEQMKLWPKGRVPYIISDGLNSAAREKINEAIEEFHQKTCIKFVPKRKKDKDYVHIVPHHDSCYVNYIGKKRSGGRQNVYLTPICQRNKGDIQHELMHVLGFWHEQSRYDRDNYVKINKQNIEEGKSSNFDKRKKIDSADFEQDLIDRTPYDYCSLMHYPAYAFTKGTGPTIEVLKPWKQVNCTIGHQKRFSIWDLIKIKLLYKCGK